MTEDHTTQDAPESEIDETTSNPETPQGTIDSKEQEPAIEQLLDEQDIQEQDAKASVFVPIEQLATRTDQAPPSPEQNIPEETYTPPQNTKQDQQAPEKEFDPHAFITLDEKKIARDETPEFWQSLSAGRHEKITYDTIEKQVLDTEIDEILLNENRAIEPHEHRQFSDSVQELYKDGHLTRLEVAHFTARTNPQEFQTQMGWHLGKLADYEADGGPEREEQLLKNPQPQLKEIEEIGTAPITYDTSIKSEIHAIISEIEQRPTLENETSVQDIYHALEHLQQHNELSEREKKHFSRRLDSSQELLKSTSATYQVPSSSQRDRTTETELSLPF